VTGIERADIERFRDIVARRFGLRFDDTRLGQLAEVLHRQLESARGRPGVYLSRIDSGGLAPSEARALIGELTVSETYLFRNVEQFRALTEVALPARMAARSGSRRLRLLSAGCASGDEAYSIAMLAREQPGLDAWDVSIEGVDLSAIAIEKATRARYSAWSLRETPADVQERFFRVDGRDFVLDPAIRAMVRFEVRNLSEEDPTLWRPEAFDVVFCRNVLMYLTAEAAAAVVERIARSLAPGGFLFLGHAETLRGLSRDFHLQHTHGTFYYRRREERETEAVDPVARRAASLRDVRGQPPPLLDLDGSWVENIRRASERVASLTRDASSGTRRTAEPVAVRARGESPRPDLVQVVDLVRAERYADAQAVLGRLPEDMARDPDVLLLKAVLLTHGGELASAERVCGELLAADELNAGAHYVRALCREGAGALDAAVEDDQLASYLDPAFAMPRLHLGLLARRAGDRNAARRELEQALALLEKEEPARLLLFGGGFGREALVALCRSELLRCGGAP
jgi:chemotaxis protein methyltransferase CheR